MVVAFQTEDGRVAVEDQIVPLEVKTSPLVAKRSFYFELVGTFLWRLWLIRLDPLILHELMHLIRVNG